MKILYVVNGFYPEESAGTELHTYYLAKEQSKNNDVYVFTRSGAKKQEYTNIDDIYEGIHIRRIVNNFLGVTSLLDYYKNKEIEDKFKEYLYQIRPDIVHVQHCIGLSASIIEIIKKAKIPLVVTLHDYWYMCHKIKLIDDEGKICPGPDKGKCCNITCADSLIFLPSLAKIKIIRMIYPFLPFKNILNKIKYYFLMKKNKKATKRNKNNPFINRTQYLQKILNKADIIIAPSKSIQKKFFEFGIDKRKIKFLPHGLDKSLFKNFKRKKTKKLRFGFIGSLIPEKGPHILIKAFNKIQNKNIELLIFGDSYDKNYKTYLKRLAKINKNIKFKKSFKNENITEAFSQINVLVIPSLWQETFSIILREAILTKTPVIASDIGALKEAVDKNNQFKAGDIYELYKKLLDFQQKKSSLSKLKQPILSIKEYTNRINRLYSLCLNQRKK